MGCPPCEFPKNRKSDLLIHDMYLNNVDDVTIIKPTVQVTTAQRKPQKPAKPDDGLTGANPATPRNAPEICRGHG